jgi:hypothetical protein
MAYESVYPPAQTDAYIKATSRLNDTYCPYFATDPTKSLINSPSDFCSWEATGGLNQRFHIDLGSVKVIKRIYYENGHNSGSFTDKGAKNFTFWGSNNADAFADLVYGDDTNWTQLTTSASLFDQHVSQNQTDPKYITVTNTTAYRYYAFKFADNWGGSRINIRRIELQTEKVPDPPTSVFATDDLTDKVRVAWTAGMGETGGHRVYRNGVDISGVVAHGTATYDDTTGATGVTYSYTVKAINDAGVSVASTADDGTKQVRTISITDTGAGSDILGLLQRLMTVLDSGAGADLVINYRQDSKRVYIIFTPGHGRINFTPGHGRINFTPEKGTIIFTIIE